ncbi:MAG: hypothetical protein HY287_13600 [Planctomycetes bacterium]|nr:hypothetical protein [Planctomycetota bacterium]MBI3835357.1 hypothetical protein [Planctomycetota bacterium]
MGTFVVTFIFMGSIQSAEPFTYQGQIKDSGIPVNGTVGLTFKLFDAVSNGNQQGNTLTFNGQAVVDGLFTVALDFGFNNTLWFDVIMYFTQDSQFVKMRQWIRI